jgi:hypothetical protein
MQIGDVELDRQKIMALLFAFLMIMWMVAAAATVL